jgi:SAM-dependent methyltransferase
MARQTLALLDSGRRIGGYAEIGSKGRYCRSLARALPLEGPTYLIDDRPPGYAPVDILERGQIARLGTHVPLGDWAPIPEAMIPSESVDLATCYVGLHHMTPQQLVPFLRSVCRILRPGGVFVVRDHDVSDERMRLLVSLAHTVFNAGLGEPWETNAGELRFFTSVDEWIGRLAAAGLVDTGHRMLQAHDPTANTLMAFTKPKRADRQDDHRPLANAPGNRAGEPAARRVRAVGD